MDPLETLRALVYQPPDEARRDQLWEILSDLSATSSERDTLQIAVDYLRGHLARWPETLQTPPESFFEDPTLRVDDPRFDLFPASREAALMRFIDARYPNPQRRQQAIEEAFGQAASPPEPDPPPPPTPEPVWLPQGEVIAALERDLEALGGWRDGLGQSGGLQVAEAATAWLKAIDARGERLSWDHGRIWREVSGELESPSLAAGLLVDLVGAAGAENRAWCAEMLDGTDLDEKSLTAAIRARLSAAEAPGGVHLLRWLVDRGRTAEQVDLFIQGLTGSPDQRALCAEALSTCSPQLLNPAIEHLRGGPDPTREAIARLFERVPNEAWVAPLRRALALTRTERTRDALHRALHWNRLAALLRGAPIGDEAIEAALGALLAEARPTPLPIALPALLPTLRTLGGVPLPDTAARWLLGVLHGLDPDPPELDPTLGALRLWLDEGDCAALFDALQAHSRASGHPERTRPFILSALSVLGNDAQLHGFGEALDRVTRPSSPWLEHGLVLLRRAPRPAAIAWCARWRRLSPNIGLSEGAAALLRDLSAQRDLEEAALIEQNLPPHSAPQHLAWLPRHLEEAMIARRRWPLAAFQALFAHPLTSQLARNLVFEAHSGDDTALLTLPQALALDDPQVALLIPHPMDLSLSELTLARSLQSGEPPFDQLGRGDLDDLNPSSVVSEAAPGACERLHRRLIALGYDPILRDGFTARARRQFGQGVFVTIAHSGYNLGPTWLDGPPVEVLDALVHLDGQRTPWARLPTRIPSEVCRELRAMLWDGPPR